MLKNLINKFYLMYINSVGGYEKKVNYLRRKGAKIGNNVRLNCRTHAFGSEPYLVSVGDNCLFAANINIITHDGGVTVLNRLMSFEKKMDKVSPVSIGSNVYIGMGAYIMPGVKIGDNCIIGAGAIVTKDIPSNSVAVGIPARVHCTVEQYYEKCKDTLEPTVEMPKEEKKQFYIKKFGL